MDIPAHLLLYPEMKSDVAIVGFDGKEDKVIVDKMKNHLDDAELRIRVVNDEYFVDGMNR